MNLAIRGVEADFGAEHAGIQERNHDNDVVLANSPFGVKAYQRPTCLKGDLCRNSQQYGCNL